MTGWTCPKCGACYAPSVTKCEACKPRAQRSCDCVFPWYGIVPPPPGYCPYHNGAGSGGSTSDNYKLRITNGEPVWIGSAEMKSFWRGDGWSGQ